MNLADYVLAHTERGACTCGRCIDAPAHPEADQPSGHTADVRFFQVALVGEPKADELRALIDEHPGEFVDLRVLDGGPFDFINLGAWIGDQGLALQLMGLGSLLGLWKLYPNAAHPTILVPPRSEGVRA